MPQGWWRTINSVMTPIWPTIKRCPIEHGTAGQVMPAASVGFSPRKANVRQAVQRNGRFSGAVEDGVAHA
jgi:hypothetical protein